MAEFDIKDLPEMVPLSELFPTPSTGIIGEKKSYIFAQDTTQFKLWFMSAIEWVPTDGKFRACVAVKYKSSDDLVSFRSWHQDYNDAERVITHMRQTMNGTAEKPINHIYGETISIHKVKTVSGNTYNVTEVLPIYWVMMEGATS